MNIETGRLPGRQIPVTNTAAQSALPPLTKNQKMIYSALIGLGRSAKAYELLDDLRPNGVKAAPTIYRALHELESKGLVQHIVSSRTFVALSEPQSTSGQKVMLVCDDCGKTRSIESKSLLTAVAANASNRGFSVRSSHLEISTSCGICNRCNREVS